MIKWSLQPSAVEENSQNLLVSVSNGEMVVASDYSGQHKEASHESYCFLVTNDQALINWLPILTEFRDQWLPDNRRMSFKKLKEPVRWRALPKFLETAGELRGNLITILVDRRVGSFIAGGPDAALRLFPDCFPERVKAGTVEKMMRLANFIALIIAGFRREDQISNWISDEDEALDSYEKRERFARLAAYLSFGVTGWQRPAVHNFGTTGLPDAPFWSEDIAAIADIVAGAYCELSHSLPTFFEKGSWQVGVNSNEISDLRARMIGNWLADTKKHLKHVLVRLELDESGGVRSSAQAFAGMR
jgi:hypothetical protein